MAVALVACLAGVVAAGMPVATLSRTKAEAADRAAALAQKQMESCRGAGYANLTGTLLHANGLLDSATPTGTGEFAFTNVDSGRSDSPGTLLLNGTGTVLIEQVDTELRRLTIRVRWTERGRAREYALTTLVANL